jgi:hypothetical protein
MAEYRAISAMLVRISDRRRDPDETCFTMLRAGGIGCMIGAVLEAKKEIPVNTLRYPRSRLCDRSPDSRTPPAA